MVNKNAPKVENTKEGCKLRGASCKVRDIKKVARCKCRESTSLPVYRSASLPVGNKYKYKEKRKEIQEKNKSRTGVSLACLFLCLKKSI